MVRDNHDVFENMLCLFIDLLNERFVADFEGGLIPAHPSTFSTSEYGARNIHDKVFTIFSRMSKETLSQTLWAILGTAT
jgi:hypothetical protein